MSATITIEPIPQQVLAYNIFIRQVHHLPLDVVYSHPKDQSSNAANRSQQTKTAYAVCTIQTI